MSGFYEHLRAEALRQQGYVVFTVGLPDLIAFRENGGTVSLYIEEEKAANAPFQPNQLEILKWFKRAGATANVYFRDGELFDIDAVPAKRKRFPKQTKFEELPDGGRRYYVDIWNKRGVQTTIVRYQCNRCKVWRVQSGLRKNTLCMGCNNREKEVAPENEVAA